MTNVRGDWVYLEGKDEFERSVWVNNNNVMIIEEFDNGGAVLRGTNEYEISKYQYDQFKLLRVEETKDEQC